MCVCVCVCAVSLAWVMGNGGCRRGRGDGNVNDCLLAERSGCLGRRRLQIRCKFMLSMAHICLPVQRERTTLNDYDNFTSENCSSLMLFCGVLNSVEHHTSLRKEAVGGGGGVQGAGIGG